MVSSMVTSALGIGIWCSMRCIDLLVTVLATRFWGRFGQGESRGRPKPPPLRLILQASGHFQPTDHTLL